MLRQSVLERFEPQYALAAQQESWHGQLHPYSSNYSHEDFAEAKLVFEINQQVIRLFHDRGVLLTVGTDLMNPWITPGVSLHRDTVRVVLKKGA